MSQNAKRPDINVRVAKLPLIVLRRVFEHESSPPCRQSIYGVTAANVALQDEERLFSLTRQFFKQNWPGIEASNLPRKIGGECFSEAGLVQAEVPEVLKILKVRACPKMVHFIKAGVESNLKL